MIEVRGGEAGGDGLAEVFKALVSSGALIISGHPLHVIHGSRPLPDEDEEGDLCNLNGVFPLTQSKKSLRTRGFL